MNRIVFGYKELVSAPQTVQLYINVISLLAEQFTMEAEGKKLRKKSLTLGNRVILEKLTVPQLVKFTKP